MNPYQFPVTCYICGGEGAGPTDAINAMWGANKNLLRKGFVERIVHKNPEVCRDFLERKRAALSNSLNQIANNL